jgi:hypothetical protein
MATLILVLWLAAAAAAADSKPKPATLIGLVVDTGCYLSHDTRGEKHIPCATRCAKDGVPLAILEEGTASVYLPVALDHKNPNTKLMPFIEKKVKVTGSVLEKGAMKGIIIRSVEAAPF